MARRPRSMIRTLTTPALLALFAVLAACGGGGSSAPGTPTPEVPTPAGPPLTPAPSFSYKPETATCNWVAAHIEPFVWPTQTVGPRNWPPVQVQTVDTPQRNAKGEALYYLSSNAWVLQGHYGPQIQAKGLPYSSTQLWAQEAVCKYGFSLEVPESGIITEAWSAYLPDETAQHLTKEQYTGSIRQVRKEDPCKPEIVITGMQLPPECSAKAP
jgi:hypothetical protein